MYYPLGVVGVAFAPDDPVTASARALDLGFDFIDTGIDVDPATLALPLGCPIAPKPVPQFCMALARRTWEATVEAFRAAPGALLEAAAASCVGSNEAVRAMCEEVPGLRLLVDVGHVADWGGDPVEILDLAGHIQLRQGKLGNTQLPLDDPTGTVDFRAILERLEAIDYQGMLSVEYFNLPDYGWPLADPVGCSVEVAKHVRGLMGPRP